MSTKRVLVAHGGKHGATAGIAEQIGVSLREDGLDVVVAPADDVTDVRGEQRDIPPVRAVAREKERLGAREHVTFDGSITARTPGVIARALVHEGKGGDVRNPERIQAWAHHIGAEPGAVR